MGGDLFSFFSVVFGAFSFVLIRGVLPRFRYDKLMDLCWKVFLSVSLNYLVLFFGLKVYFFILYI